MNAQTQPSLSLAEYNEIRYKSRYVVGLTQDDTTVVEEYPHNDFLATMRARGFSKDEIERLLSRMIEDDESITLYRDGVDIFVEMRY